MAQKNVIQLTTTTTTAGTYFELTIPDGSGGYISRKITFATVQEAVNDANSKNKGYYVDEAALVAAYPTGENGWYAIVGDTDTVWLWDDDTGSWVDSGNQGSVISVNGLTGAVVLEAVDIAFSSAQGLSATNVRDGIDELKVYVDDVSQGAGGIYVNQSRVGKDAAITPGDNFIAFSDNLIDTDYGLFITESDDLGLDTENIVKAGNGFTVNAIGTGTIDYMAIAESSTGVDFEGNFIVGGQAHGGNSEEAFSATKTFDADEGNNQQMEVTASTTIDIENELPGTFLFTLIINSVSSPTITIGSSFGTPYDNNASLLNADGDENLITLVVKPDGTKRYSINTLTA